ncbi:MAG: molybdopterin molybdotransferase MoeA [Actinomycetota bacterium]|nr:MAG: molybdopterin molybdotransferase MoeA [Actinomycetota bacterium]
MISVEEAQRIVLNSGLKPGIQRLPILESLGLTLAEDIISSDDIPIYDNSAMDGYAVRAIDIKGAEKSYPIRLVLMGEDIPAGRIPKSTVNPGFCMPIMTGAPLPNGADSVVMKEDTQRDAGSVMVFREIEKGENVRYRSEDIKKGSTVFRKGDNINPATIGVLASLGIGEVKVYRPPLVGVLATGDELIRIDEKLIAGKVRDSNSYSLSAQVKEMGMEYRRFGTIVDDETLLLKKIKEALGECDILLLSGGISVGDYDLVKDTLEGIGAKLIFWRVNQKPGKPLAFFKYGNKYIFGLPGNPVSVMVCFEMYVRPMIRKSMGYDNFFRPEVIAEALDDFKNKTGRVNFARIIVENKDGKYFFKSTGMQGSGILTSMAKANGIARFPADMGNVVKGSKVKVYLLGEL